MSKNKKKTQQLILPQPVRLLSSGNDSINKNFIKMPSLALEKDPHNYTLIVTKELETKIRRVCDRWPNNEWSGTLFYTIEGSFKNKDLKIYAKDFYLQDKGTAGFTQFKNDVNLAGYMVDNNLMDCYMGLIHSHDTMAKN